MSTPPPMKFAGSAGLDRVFAELAQKAALAEMYPAEPDPASATPCVDHCREIGFYLIRAYRELVAGLELEITGGELEDQEDSLLCEIEGCKREATCGSPTDEGYKRLCGKHFNEVPGGVGGARE